MSRTLLIAGGTGLIGNAIQKIARDRGWQVTLLSRQKRPGALQWDPEKRIIHLQEKLKFDAIINLAGSTINRRWTTAVKNDILQSRLKSCATLEVYLFDGRLATDVYIGASAVGIYGDSGSAIITEASPVHPDDWFERAVMKWEEGHKKIAALDIRTAILRTAMVLGSGGGAYPELLQTSRFGFLAYFGAGDQMVSWIHEEDLARMYLFAAERSDLSGIFIASSPGPVTNKELTGALSNSFPKPRILLPVPKLLMKLVFGKMSRVLFDSCYAIPQRFLETGFEFRYPRINDAAKDLITKYRK